MSMSALLTACLLSLPAIGSAQTLTLFANDFGKILVGNSSGSFPGQVPSSSFDRTRSYTFIGRIGAVSDQPSRIWLAAHTADGYVVYNMSTGNGGTAWRGWAVVPGSRQGGACAGSHCYTWKAESGVALTSWGSGRLEIFINALRDDNATALLHTWGDNGSWSGRWESLGTGLWQGTPTAVSWGPGRTDVFMQGSSNDLIHKWFENGRWSSGWENLGGTVTASPAVTSMRPGHLDVSLRGGLETGRALWHIWFADFNWSGFELLGGDLAEDRAIAAASRGDGFLDLFVYALDRNTVYELSYANGWLPPRLFAIELPAQLTALYWFP
jgi:hypothetical protein